MAKVVIIVIVFIVIAVWWMFFRVARSAVPPLTIDENDPLMREATTANGPPAANVAGAAVKLYNNQEIDLLYRTRTQSRAGALPS